MASHVVAELKRMYAARGRAVGRALLGTLEHRAHALGARRIMPETGTRQTAALGLYHGAGYTRTEPFGEFVGSPHRVCLAKTLL